jgi:CRP-like cAMP-binding protein
MEVYRANAMAQIQAGNLSELVRFASEYVYQVNRGAVRTYKLLNDGRRQIGAFHPPGDVFGLDAGPDAGNRLAGAFTA